MTTKRASTSSTSGGPTSCDKMFVTYQNFPLSSIPPSLNVYFLPSFHLSFLMDGPSCISHMFFSVSLEQHSFVLLCLACLSSLIDVVTYVYDCPLACVLPCNSVYLHFIPWHIPPIRRLSCVSGIFPPLFRSLISLLRFVFLV